MFYYRITYKTSKNILMNVDTCFIFPTAILVLVFNSDKAEVTNTLSCVLYVVTGIELESLTVAVPFIVGAEDIVRLEYFEEPIL